MHSAYTHARHTAHKIHIPPNHFDGEKQKKNTSFGEKFYVAIVFDANRRRPTNSRHRGTEEQRRMCKNKRDKIKMR